MKLPRSYNISFKSVPVSPRHNRQDTVRSTFGECGDIKSVRFAEDRETGEFRGFGHVEFYDGACVDAAMQLASTDVMGRPIRVSFALCKTAQHVRAEGVEPGFTSSRTLRRCAASGPLETRLESVLTRNYCGLIYKWRFKRLPARDSESIKIK